MTMTMTIAIDSMSCGGCARSVARAVAGVDPAARVTPDLAARTVEIDTAGAPEAILAALEKAGFAGVPVGSR